MLREISMDEIPTGSIGRGYAVQTIREFWKSGMAAAEVELPGKNCQSVYVSLMKARGRLDMPVDVMTRRGKIYLVRREEKS